MLIATWEMTKGSVGMVATCTDYIVLSYPRADRMLARLVELALIREGISVFRDNQMDGGVDWRFQLRERIKNASAVLGLITENTRNAQYQLDEVDLAVQSKKLIPLIYGEPDISMLAIGSLQSIPLHDFEAEEMALATARVVRAIRRRANPQLVEPKSSRIAG